MNKDLKVKLKLSLIKIFCLFNPKVVMYEGFLFDGHHALIDINTQDIIISEVILDKISEEDLKLIDSMRVEEENIYSRMRVIDALRFRIINSMLKSVSKDGYSVKKVNLFYGDNPFELLYEFRKIDFRMLCNKYPELSFKTKKHFDEENDPMFNGCFLAGIYTPLGIVTYHFKVEDYDSFLVPQLERGPKYDNYDIKEVLYRIASLVDEDMVRKHLKEKEASLELK